MDFLKDLMHIAESKSAPKKKKKPLKKAAHQVYHRDYLATKNKPYRKYHKEHTNEGIGDYFRGAGSELSSKMSNIAQPFKDIHRAGKQANVSAKIKKAALVLANTIQQYYFLKQKLKELNPGMNEGIGDYLRGAGSEISKKMSNVAQPFRDIHRSGKIASLEKETDNLKREIKSQANTLAMLTSRMGSSGNDIVKQALQDVPNNIKLTAFKQLKAAQRSVSAPEQAGYTGPGIQSRNPRM